MRAQHRSVGRSTSDPTPRAVAEPTTPASEPEAVRPNRAARRGARDGVPGNRAHGAAPHARGAQGRRVNPIRRTG
jgi:hypothetical protein